MKTLYSIALLSFLLFAIFASEPPSTHASDDWVYVLSDCTDIYITGYGNAWGTWDTSAQGPADENQLDYNLNQAFYNFQGCNSVVNVPYAEIDFCPAAQQAYYNCVIQFQGLDNTFARMECQAATHYEGTCV